ncbi:MAG: metal ABC transporter substrate-binding protein [Desulfovibrionaceae bacterium]|nr:metal ABC transporter substrate-binding protein [Desulfovibrionaceae bacterium]
MHLFVLIVSFLICVFSPTACFSGDSGVLRIGVSTFPMYLMTRQIVGDSSDVRISLLVPAQSGCPHDLVLSPSSMRTVEQTDIIIRNGLGMEPFLDAIALNKPFIDAVNGTTRRLAEPSGHPNPHLFASPACMAGMIRYTAAELGRIRPDQAEFFATRAEQWAAEYEKVAAECAQIGKKLTQRRVMFRDGSLAYFAEDVGLETAALIEEHEGHEPSASDLMRLIRVAETVCAVIGERFGDDKTARTIAGESGCAYFVLDAGVAGSEEAPEDHLLQIMRQNLRTLEAMIGTK